MSVCWEELDALLAQRRSCRGFLAEPVPRELLVRLFTSAQRAPSWCNTQPWQLTVVSGAALDELRTHLGRSTEVEPDVPFPSAYRGVHLQRRRESGWQLYEAVGVAGGDRVASAREAARNFEFFGAPHAAIMTVDSDLGAYGVLDCGLYIGTLLMAAEALGLGACAQAAIAARAPALRSFLGLPESRLVVCGISLGYADPAHPSATCARLGQSSPRSSPSGTEPPAHSGAGN